MQEEKARTAQAGAAAFQAWASHCQSLHDRRVLTIKNSSAAAFRKQACTRRALAAWAMAMDAAQQLQHMKGLRDMVFRLWRGRAKDKRACPSTVSARCKLKVLGWANEVCGAPALYDANMLP